ncbi:hypothetical protein IGI04_015136 [Brassica rapa subsp. trilocularis]|uniref:Uncharacterized protein n=1 Tax=Brassica rapa subsp. trilocularis TaxID=1813537 RepID=A0ABQ7MSL1_BRACM|nr:hypothetical protein IGI04_015136 [Brassica rapa subsp. trilocularis]
MLKLVTKFPKSYCDLFHHFRTTLLFYNLVHLELCIDSTGKWDLLTWMLESSQNRQRYMFD